MESSDEETDVLPDSVTNYEFVDAKNQSVSFSCMPLSWLGNGDDLDATYVSNPRIYVHGTTPDGLEKIYKQVIAWKYNLNSLQPEVFVLSIMCKGKHWIRLLKPRKRFEAIVRSALVTVHFIHYAKRNPQAPGECIWKHLSAALSSYDDQPCERDVIDHIGLVKEAFKTDMDLPKSEYVCELLGKQPRRRRLIKNTAAEKQPVKKRRFVSDEAEEGKEDDQGLEEENGYNGMKDGEEEEEEMQLFDTCCAICDNGGDILCCEGPCMRSFHATRASGEDSCRSLGLSQAQVDAMPVFFCKNCHYKKHQCSVCGELGSSDNSSHAEVFCCVSAACGRFYHPKCVAKALYETNAAQARNCEAQVAAGAAFTCPAHNCLVCGHGEDRNLRDLQFAICRRCPKAYHRKCLPGGISFEDDEENNVQQRAWDDLLPKRILLYCLDHEILPRLGTPSRKHIVFPATHAAEETPAIRKIGTEKKILKNKGELVTKKLSKFDEADKVASKLKISKDGEGVRSARNVMKYTLKPGSDNLRKTQFVEGSSKFSPSQGKIHIKKACPSSSSHGRKPARNFENSEKTTAMTKPVRVDTKPLNVESGIDSLIEEVNSSFNINDFKSHQAKISCYTGSGEIWEKSITMGKVEATVKAVHAALEKIKNGGSTEDVMNICPPPMLSQLAKWKQRLQVSLGPFLHGTRYTSFGRHFTKPEKLEVIVDMLHWYVQDGDMIVDFSCGSNDFSCMMSKKLESVAKSCLFKNYDLHHTKNDFNFERRDWFSVKKEELPDGSRLVIGLNPPFGVNAVLANQFIDKALEFKPKLLILIVPSSTQRLDLKRPPYDLIWEDGYLLAGKSFYLPGSIDVHNKRLEQWNLKSPPLYLWSRPDWTRKHREIAMARNHFPADTQGINSVPKEP